MPRVLDPFRFLLIAMAGWMNQHQVQMIEYLREENRVLREQTRRPPLAIQRRPAPPTRGPSQRVGAQAAGRGGHSGHPRNLIDVASETDRAEIRWQWPAAAGTP